MKGLKKFKKSAIGMCKELAEGCDGDINAINGFNEIIALIKNAEDFDAVERIIINEIGFTNEEIIMIYRWAL